MRTPGVALLPFDASDDTFFLILFHEDATMHWLAICVLRTKLMEPVVLALTIFLDQFANAVVQRGERTVDLAENWCPCGRS